MISCDALSMGPAAWSILSGGPRLRVQGRFASALNLEVEGSGRLVSLRSAGGCGLPHEVVLDRTGELRRWPVAVGARVRLTADALQLPVPSGVVIVDLRHASRLPRRELPAIVRLGAAHRACSGSLAARQGGCDLRLESLRGEAERATTMGERLRVAALGLAAAVRGPSAPLRRAVAALVGLGPGLTPAGDDLLCGFLAAARAADPSLLAVLHPATEASLPRTGDISAFLLRCALEGLWPAALVDLAEALAAERAPEALAALGELCRLGHSSGRDLATGFLFGLRCLLR